MANEFRIKNGLIIGDSQDGESLPISGIVSSLATATNQDLVTGSGIRAHLESDYADAFAGVYDGNSDRVLI